MSIWLHTVDSLSIRRYGEIDRSGNIGLLRRWWNVLPVKWFNVQDIIKRISESVSSEANKMVIRELDKIYTYNKILKLQACYSGIYNIIVLKARNDSYGVTRRRSSNLTEYLNRVENITGIKITDLKGLDKLQNEITRLKDKYVERFKEKKQQKEVPFMQYALSVFAFMEMDYNPNMKLSEFSELITVANKKIKQLDKLKNARHK